MIKQMLGGCIKNMFLSFKRRDIYIAIIYILWRNPASYEQLKARIHG